MAQRFWVVIPAAGSGRRMGAGIPKQYLPLHGRTVIEWSLASFLEQPAIEGIVVAVTDGDPYWRELALGDRKLFTTTGGAERMDSVVNGLHKLSAMAAPDDWVLVHDAARPCLASADLEHLITELRDHPVGGVLGRPINDTVKRIDVNDEVIDTPNRSRLWRAFTPQMFHLKTLTDALVRAGKRGNLVTDDAAAMELAGFRPKMVRGRADNIKITQSGDLQLAELFLREQAKQCV